MNTGTGRSAAARDRRDAGSIRPDLVARVMAGVAREPRPTPARALAAALRHGAAREAMASVATAWRLGTMRGRRVAPAVRARSLVLAVGVTGMLATSGVIAFASVADAARHVVGQAGLGEIHHPAAAPAAPTTTPFGSPSPLPAAAPLVRVPPDDHDADVMPRDRGHRTSATTPGGGTPGAPATPSTDGTAGRHGDGSAAGSDGGGGDGAATPRPTDDGGDAGGTTEPSGDGSAGGGGSDGTDQGSTDASATPDAGGSGSGETPSDGG
jgi:hypothetical protein